MTDPQATPAPRPARTPPKVPRPAPAPLVRSRTVDALGERLAAGEPAARVAAGLWAGVAARTPVVEPVPGSPDERIVTFLWRDADAEAVLLFVNRLTDERNLADSLMRRLPGTDIWHLAYRMDADWRASYAFLPHRPGRPAPWTDGQNQVSVRAALDRGLADPRNPVANLNRAGVRQSVVELPAAPAQPWLHPRPGVPRGTVTRREAPGGRTVWVYEPPGGGHRDLPVLVALDGDVWTGPQDLPTTLDNLVHDGEVPPTLAVLVDAGSRERRWSDLDEDGRIDDWLVAELLPWVRATYPVSARATDVTVAGQSLGALSALWTLVRHPDAVGAVVSQSASLWQGAILEAVRDVRLAGTRAYLEVGRQEWVLRAPHAPLAERLRASGAEVELVEFNGGHDYACWRGGIAQGLRRTAATAAQPPVGRQ